MMLRANPITNGTPEHSQLLAMLGVIPKPATDDGGEAEFLRNCERLSRDVKAGKVRPGLSANLINHEPIPEHNKRR